MTTPTTPTAKTVGDLTVAELVALLRETVAESLAEIVGYPDEQPEPEPGAEAETEQGAGADGSQAADTAAGSQSQAGSDGTGVAARMARKVGGLTVEDFRFWVHQIVGEVGEDLIGDPDEGLEFRPEFVAGLLEAAKEARVAGQLTIPDEQIAEMEELAKGYDLTP